MKKLIMFLLIFCSSIVAYSQVPFECESDSCYQNQTWTSLVHEVQMGALPDCNDCWVRLYFKVRDKSTDPNCASMQQEEFRFDFAVVSGSCYYAPCNYYSQWEVEQPYKDAMLSFLDSLGLTPVFPDSCGPVLKDYNILNCYRVDRDLDSNNILHACNSFGCCKQDLQICKNSMGEMKVQANVKAGVESCDTDTTYPGECITICDWIDDALLPKKIRNDNSKSYKNPLDIKYDSQSENIQLVFDTKVNIDEYSIIDINGKMITRENNVTTNLLSVSYLPPGVYIITIKSKENIYHSSFIRE